MKKLILPLLLLCLLALVASAAVADPFRAKFNVFTGEEKQGVRAAAVDGDWDGFGNLEGRAVKPLYPLTWDAGGGIGLQLFTVPKAVPVFSQRKIFADFLVSTANEDQAYIALAISLLGAPNDNGVRLGVEAIGPNPWKTFYLGKAFNFDF